MWRVFFGGLWKEIGIGKTVECWFVCWETVECWFNPVMPTKRIPLSKQLIRQTLHQRSALDRG